MDDVLFEHRATGRLHFDPLVNTKHFDPWWALLICDEGIVSFYAWLLKRYGVPTEQNKLWGPHISVIKSQEPQDKTNWGKGEGSDVEFWYTTKIRWDNEKHAWLDVFSPQMSRIREELGLAPKCYYHLTIGRLK